MQDKGSSAIQLRSNQIFSVDLICSLNKETVGWLDFPELFRLYADYRTGELGVFSYIDLLAE